MVAGGGHLLFGLMQDTAAPPHASTTLCLGSCHPVLATSTAVLLLGFRHVMGHVALTNISSFESAPQHRWL
jgi:hypothetical protein